ncbi:MAG: ATP-binding cassette domain-containing protein [Bdellovibrionia bacterium]
MTIELKEISKSYQGKEVIQKLSLTFSEGQTHVLLGSSGSGKSTLLRIIMGLIFPDCGTVLIDQHSMSPRLQPFLAQQIGYVPQDGGLFPHLTAEKNVTLVARTLKWSQSRIEERLRVLSEMVSIKAQLLSRYPSELSGGQRQRVAMIRGAFLDPQVMLLDEPLAALDPIFRKDLQLELKKIFSQLKKTVIFVTHDIGEAAFLGHSVILLRDGKVVQRGKFSEFLRSPVDPFVTEFIGAQRTLQDMELYD